MPVFAQYNFSDTGLDAHDSALGNGEQTGIYLNGATAAGGQAVLDGENDLVKIWPDPSFQLDRGTLAIHFTLSDTPVSCDETILSRDSVGETDGGYRVVIQPDGAVVISHESAGGTTTFTTGAGFANPGDGIELTYSWDKSGDGGALGLTNITSAAVFTGAVPEGLTMDMGAINQPWMVGAGQTLSTPGILNDVNEHFSGTVDLFQISDTVDNLDIDGQAGRDGIINGTPGDDLIDVNYLGDNDGDRVDANDAVVPGDGPDDDRIFALGGNDTVFGGNGNDTIFGGTGDDLLFGGTGNDLIFGGSGNDIIFGNDGDDTLVGGEGSDLVSGGEGNDLILSGSALPRPDIDYPGLWPADTDPFDDRDTVFGGAGDDTIFTGDDADLVSGGEGNDLIDGGVDADTLFGGDGNDTIFGAEGSDVIGGGDGDDLIYGGYGPAVPDAVNIPDDQGDLRPENGRDEISGGAGDDTIFGMDDDDTLLGGAGNDFLDGGIDDDLITGNEDNDTIVGGQGADSMFGGDGRDTFIVNGPGEGIGDYIDGNEGGDDLDTLDLRGSGPFRISYAEDNPENGVVDYLDDDGNVTGSLTFVNIENVIPCFTPGTLIATPRGEVPVQLLRAGDRIVTRDNGLQDIRWVGSKEMGWHDLVANPHLQPVLIRQGSLGNGLPERDMMVSPNHRMLVANDRTALYFDEHEVLVAAKHLTAGRGVTAVESVGTTYIHFMFDRHEVVLANGAWTESFQPGDFTLKGLGNAQRSEIFELFPDLKTDAGVEGYTAARRTLKKHEALLIAR